MFIKYSGNNVHAMPYVNSTGKDLIQSPQDVQWFRPGWNEFPAAVWKQNEKNPQVQKMLQKGILEVFSQKVKVQVKDKKSGRVKTVEKVVGLDDKPIKLKYFDEKQSVEIVKGTLNREILQRWIDEERRHKVMKALRKQIEPLLNKSQDDEDSEAEDYDDEEDWE